MSSKYSKEILSDAVKESKSFAGVLRYLGVKQAGGTQSHITSKIKEYDIDTSHFTGKVWNKGLEHKHLQRSKESILVLLPENSPRPRRRLLLRAMLESGIEYVCQKCGLTDRWQNDTLVLEVDHIDGNWLNNLISNLRFLCPNCHSQQVTNRSHKNKYSHGALVQR